MVPMVQSSVPVTVRLAELAKDPARERVLRVRGMAPNVTEPPLTEREVRPVPGAKVVGPLKVTAPAGVVRELVGIEVVPLKVVVPPAKEAEETVKELAKVVVPPAKEAVATLTGEATAIVPL